MRRFLAIITAVCAIVTSAPGGTAAAAERASVETRGRSNAGITIKSTVPQFALNRTYVYEGCTHNLYFWKIGANQVAARITTNCSNRQVLAQIICTRRNGTQVASPVITDGMDASTYMSTDPAYDARCSARFRTRYGTPYNATWSPDQYLTVYY